MLELMDNYFEKNIFIIEYIDYKDIIFMVVHINLYNWRFQLSYVAI